MSVKESSAVGVEYWRDLAKSTGERLKIQETQLKDLRIAADEARARVTKYKGRLENAQEKVNELQARLIAVSVERDALVKQLTDQEAVKRKIYEYRQSLLVGPIWDVFAEFCRDVAPAAAEGESHVEFESSGSGTGH